MAEYNVFLVGFGNVGRELARLLVEGGHGLPVRLTGVASSRGVVIVGGPADLVYFVKLALRGERLDKHPGFREGFTALEGALLAGADVAMITMPPSYATGEPNRHLYYSLLDEEVSIITADKTVLALDYKEVTSRAEANCLYLGYRATVAAGTPAIDAARGLRLRDVRGIRAVLNASTNYILGYVEKGYSYDEAIQQAIRAKLAEPDPTMDIHGLDPAAKLVILANELGYHYTIRDVERVPLESIPEDVVRTSLAEGKRVKYVAEADFRRGELRVSPRILEPGDPLARAEGEGNVIEFLVEDNPIVLEGPAGPAWRTARVMLTDLGEYVQAQRRLGDCMPG